MCLCVCHFRVVFISSSSSCKIFLVMYVITSWKLETSLNLTNIWEISIPLIWRCVCFPKSWISQERLREAYQASWERLLFSCSCMWERWLSVSPQLSLIFEHINKKSTLISKQVHNVHAISVWENAQVGYFI